jgi:hypothetical protein
MFTFTEPQFHPLLPILANEERGILILHQRKSFPKGPRTIFYFHFKLTKIMENNHERKTQWVETKWTAIANMAVQGSSF